MSKLDPEEQREITITISRDEIEMFLEDSLFLHNSIDIVRTKLATAFNDQVIIPDNERIKREHNE